MNSMSRHFLTAFLAAWSLGLAPTLWSQAPASEPPSNATAAAEATSTNVESTDGRNPATATDEASTPAVAAEPDDSTAPSAEPATEAAEPPLRELGVEPEETTPRESKASAPRRGSRRSEGGARERVGFGQDVIVREGETASELVAIVGSARVEGEVQEAVVSILGSTHVAGPVGGEAVAVLGSVYINSRVGGDVVAVMGNVELGPQAEVGGEVVVVGGALTRDPAAVVRRGVQNVAFGGKLGDVDWLAAYFRECVLKARPLAFSAAVGWAWWIAFGFLVFYVLLALLFRRGVEKCAETLETRPGYSVLAALLTVVLVPVATVLLAFTVVGIAVIPFFMAALFFAALFGKAVMLAWLGRRILGTSGSGYSHVALAVLLGGLIVMLLYVIPVFGFLLFKLLGWIGMGVVVYTVVLMANRDRPPAAAPSAPPPIPPPAGDTGAIPATAPEPSGLVTGGAEPAAAAAAGPAMSAGFGAPPVAAATLPVAPALPVISVATFPRAGFMIRIGALLLDVILVGIILGILSSPGSAFLPVLAGYGAVMWKMKGTTIGGIICGLKVVRLDNREVDWTTAIVRALGCFLSLAVVGLGFIWIAIDDGRQSWHDKIAGTTVVRVPKGVSLI